MYLYCDGELTIIENAPSCTNWVAVSKTELLSEFIEQYGIGQEDYAYLAVFTLTAFLMVAGIKLTIKTLFTGTKQ